VFEAKKANQLGAMTGWKSIHAAVLSKQKRTMITDLYRGTGWVVRMSVRRRNSFDGKNCSEQCGRCLGGDDCAARNVERPARWADHTTRSAQTGTQVGMGAGRRSVRTHPVSVRVAGGVGTWSCSGESSFIAQTGEIGGVGPTKVKIDTNNLKRVINRGVMTALLNVYHSPVAILGFFFFDDDGQTSFE